MPSVPMYIDENDLDIIKRWLNDHDELAYIVPLGEKTFIAQKKIDQLQDKSRYALWHVPAGNLPLVKEDGSATPIIDPWKGWNQENAMGSVPYFGPGCPNVLFLDVNMKDFNLEGNNKVDALGMSHFEWIGDHYKSIGQPASKETHLLWRKIQNFIKGNSTKISRSDHVKSKPEIYAFPGAMKLISSGMPRRDNP